MAHLARVQRIIDYIENHLTDELPLDQLAKLAGYSQWHFQHIFRATTGDALKEYIRKRRLTATLSELRESDQRIIDVAFTYCFESQAAFSRSFKKMFGVSPGVCRRKDGARLPLKGKPKITFVYLDHLYKGITMEPIIKQLSERTVVGLPTTFISSLSENRNNKQVLPKLWDCFNPRAHEIKRRIPGRALGICEALPTAVVKSQTHDAFYMASVEVDALDAIPNGMVAKKIPAGRYAVFIHKGPLAKIDHTTQYIYGSWLPKSGEELRDSPDLEIYDARYKVEAEDSEIELQIPLK
jgi:AraC family transcriptional regulator